MGEIIVILHCIFNQCLKIEYNFIIALLHCIFDNRLKIEYNHFFPPLCLLLVLPR